MRQNLPYTILAVLAVCVTGLTVLYNLVWRETFAVTVSYTLPAIQSLQPDVPEASQTVKKYAEEEEQQSEADEYYRQQATEEQMLTSVKFPLDLNRATEEELRFIPQVGNVMAQRIVQYRDHLGGYTSLDQLKEIKGVGDKTFAHISAYLYVEDEDGLESPDGEPDGADID